MTASFGSDNVIFVPAGSKLRIYDIAGWRMAEIDVLHAQVRLRPHASELFASQFREAVKAMLASKRFTERQAELPMLADKVLRALAPKNAPPNSRPAPPASISEETGFTVQWWVRIGDMPAETFFEEDYDEHEGFQSGEIDSHPLYGSVYLMNFDEFEAPFPGRGEDAAFAIDVASNGGVTSHEIPVLEPLPILDEYCGARGASALGVTINMNPKGEVEGDHLLSVPMHRIEGGLFATLYIHMTTPTVPRVMAKLRTVDLPAVAEILGRSGFEITTKTPQFICFVRGGDVVHIYIAVPGKESEGVLLMPPLLIIARAGDTTDMTLRSELLDAIVQVGLGS